MKKIEIYILGGSASSAYALPSNNLAWPKLLENKYPALSIKSQNFGGLTLVQSINKLNAINPVDVLILHFGTSIGWPSAVVNLGNKFGMDFHNEFAFHQPPFKSNKHGAKLIRHKLKMRFRNFTKYILFIFGLYKPRINPREIGDQISAVLGLIEGKADKVIWIQHQTIRTHRTRIERHYYKNFYNRIVSELKNQKPDWLELIELSENFVVPENYLQDAVHLSEIGHFKLSVIVEEYLRKFTL